MAKSRFKDFFDSVAMGGEPTKSDMLAEGFREGDIRRVRIQVAAILAKKRDGDQAEARADARSFAADWQDKFDADEDWIIESEDAALPNDPEKLAAMVPKPGTG